MDKAVRVWDVASRKLVRTLRWQIGPGRLNEPSGLLLHPDNQTVYVTTRSLEGSHANERELADRRLGLGFTAKHMADANDQSPIDTMFDLNTMTVSPWTIGDRQALARAVVARDGLSLGLVRGPSAAALILEPSSTLLTGIPEEPFYYAETFGFRPRGAIVTGDEYGAVRRIAMDDIGRA